MALVPIKGFERAKTRLSSAYPPVARARFARDLAERAIQALLGLREADEIADIVVLTDSEPVATWARSQGCRVCRDGAASGLAPAVDQGLQFAHEDLGATEALVLMADLAEVSTEALSRLLAHPAPVAAPDHHGTGTNALLTALPAPGPCSFGDPRSLALHRATWGAELSVVPIAELARDLDEPEDIISTTGRPPV